VATSIHSRRKERIGNKICVLFNNGGEKKPCYRRREKMTSNLVHLRKFVGGVGPYDYLM